MREGWAATAPGDTLDLAPLSDGGPGFVQVLHDALGGELLPATVSGPLGRARARRRSCWSTDAHGVRRGGRGVRPAPGPASPSATRPGPRPTAWASWSQAAVAAGARRVVVGVGGTGDERRGSRAAGRPRRRCRARPWTAAGSPSPGSQRRRPGRAGSGAGSGSAASSWSSPRPPTSPCSVSTAPARRTPRARVRRRSRPRPSRRPSGTTPTWPRRSLVAGRPLLGKGPGHGRGVRCRGRPGLRPAAARRPVRRGRGRRRRGDRAGRAGRPSRPGRRGRGDLRLALAALRDGGQRRGARAGRRRAQRGRGRRGAGRSAGVDDAGPVRQLRPGRAAGPTGRRSGWTRRPPSGPGRRGWPAPGRTPDTPATAGRRTLVGNNMRARGGCRRRT